MHRLDGPGAALLARQRVEQDLGENLDDRLLVLGSDPEIGPALDDRLVARYGGRRARRVERPLPAAVRIVRLVECSGNPRGELGRERHALVENRAQPVRMDAEASREAPLENPALGQGRADGGRSQRRRTHHDAKDR
jgi:hypothetical protein